MSDSYQNPSWLVVQKGKKVRPNIALLPFAAIAIYSMIIPVVLLDFWTTIYQYIYFSVNEIPMIKKSDYISFERWELDKLRWIQKINCFYCEYVNGILAWVKAVGVQTEIYSCAIKHTHLKVPKTHEKEFYSKAKFD